MLKKSFCILTIFIVVMLFCCSTMKPGLYKYMTPDRTIGSTNDIYRAIEGGDVWLPSKKITFRGEFKISSDKNVKFAAISPTEKTPIIIAKKIEIKTVTVFQNCDIKTQHFTTDSRVSFADCRFKTLNTTFFAGGSIKFKNCWVWSEKKKKYIFFEYLKQI